MDLVLSSPGITSALIPAVLMPAYQHALTRAADIREAKKGVGILVDQNVDLLNTHHGPYLGGYSNSVGVGWD